MGLPLVLVDYFVWHYTQGFLFVWLRWKHARVYLLHYFSAAELLRTLFAPFKRMKEAHSRRSWELFLSAILVNTISRLIGAMIRISLLLIALVLLIIHTLSLPLIILVWALLPFFATYITVLGFFTIV